MKLSDLPSSSRTQSNSFDKSITANPPNFPLTRPIETANFKNSSGSSAVWQRTCLGIRFEHTPNHSKWLGFFVSGAQMSHPSGIHPVHPSIGNCYVFGISVPVQPAGPPRFRLAIVQLGSTGSEPRTARAKWLRYFRVPSGFSAPVGRHTPTPVVVEDGGMISSLRRTSIQHVGDSLRGSLEVLGRKVRVPLCHGDVGMTEQSLDRIEVSTAGHRQ